MLSVIIKVVPMWDHRGKCVTKEMTLIWFFKKEYQPSEMWGFLVGIWPISGFFSHLKEVRLSKNHIQFWTQLNNQGTKLSWIDLSSQGYWNNVNNSNSLHLFPLWTHFRALSSEFLGNEQSQKLTRVQGHEYQITNEPLEKGYLQQSDLFSPGGQPKSWRL